MKLYDIGYTMIKNRCPRCHKGQVFKEINPYKLKAIFHLNTTCPHCGLKFEKEPSFFYGAMYVSYALTSGWFLMWFLLNNYIFEWDTLVFALFVTITVILLSPLSIRWSRLIWLNLFFKYDKSYKQSIKANAS